MDQLLMAYLAGFVDADGSVSIKSKDSSKPYIVCLSVHNCNRDIIDLFIETFGKGKSRYKKTSKCKLHENWRPCWEFTLTAKKAAVAIRQLYPYLRIKKRQATLALRLDRLKASGNGLVARWNPDRWQRVKTIFERLKIECKRLNRRGVVHEQNKILQTV